MPSLVSLSEPVREFFTQGRAERTVRAYAPEQQSRVRAQVQAAELRLAAGRRVTQAVPAALLLREGVLRLLTAAALARGDAGDAADSAAVASSLPELPPDPARPRADPSDDARARAALSSTDPLYLDALSAEDAERTRWALDRAASMLRRRVEARTLASVRATRWGRAAAVLVLVSWAVMALLKATVLPRNVALGKPVQPSSLRHNPPDGRELVDGDVGASFGVHTNTEDSPQVTIDLEGLYWLDTVKVHNRVDGWFDDCLPLVVEISKDGKAYEQLGRRDTHFDATPPWTLEAAGRGARYVRVRVARRSYLAISEVEVFGRKAR